MLTSTPRRRRLTARATSLVTAIAVSVLGLTALPAAAAGPETTVTPNTDVADGATLAVTGTGFANTGTGVYVAFGPDDVKTTNPDDWSSNAGLYSSVKWVQAAQITAEGTFSTTVTAALDEEHPDDVTFAVYTFKAHGVPDRTQDSVTPVTMAAPEPPAPSVTVTPATTDVESGTALTVTGADFDGTTAGVYVGFGPDDLKTTHPDTWFSQGQLYSSVQWVRVTGITDGAFSTTVTAAIDAATPEDLTYAVYTFASQGSSNRFFDTYTPIAMAGPDEPEPTTPTVEVSPKTDVAAGSTITVTGADFATSGPGVYVAYGPNDLKGTHADTWWTDASLYSDVTYVSAAALTGGGFTRTLTATENADDKTDRTFAVYTFAAQGSTDRTQDTLTPVTLKAAPKPPTTKVRSCTYGTFSKGAVTWGVKKSFRQYVTGPIADGKIVVGKPAKRLKSGEFRFRQGTGKVTKVKGGVKTASLRVKGPVTFTGHYDGNDPALRLVMRDLRIQATAKAAYLRADVSSKDMNTGVTKVYNDVRVAKLGGVKLADLAPGKGKRVTKVNVSSKRVVLTAAGAPAFGGFYTAGTKLDPIKVATTYQRKAKPTCAMTGGRGPVDGPR